MDTPATKRTLPFRLVYHPDYDLNFGAHIFPSQKYRLIREQLLATGVAAPGDFVQPEPATDEDVLQVHDREWLRGLKDGSLSYQQIRQLEIPYSRRMVSAFLLAAGGTTLAARLALEEGVGFNIGGGFHHAFRDHGEGFCAINDLAVAARSLLSRGRVRKVLVVDCDVHQGNGTAALFATATDVFTISIHQYNNYPAEKPPSTVDIHLPDGAGDEEYLSRLQEAVRPALARFQPDLVLYVAGADPYVDDQLGGLALTMEGLKQRDRLVIGTALKHRAPVAVTVAGGYAAHLQDTISIHCNTVQAAKECLLECGRPTRGRGTAG